MKETCGNCEFYMSDTKNGKLTQFHHTKEKSGFCVLRDLFFTVQKEYTACECFEPYSEIKK